MIIDKICFYNLHLIFQITAIFTIISAQKSNAAITHPFLGSKNKDFNQFKNILKSNFVLSFPLLFTGAILDLL